MFVCERGKKERVSDRIQPYVRFHGQGIYFPVTTNFAIGTDSTSIGWTGGRACYLTSNQRCSDIISPQRKSMLALQHYVAVCFLLFLPPIIPASDPGARYELVDRRTEDQHTSLHSDRLLMFGAIQMSTSAWRDKDCMLDVIVEIGENTWKEQLNSSSFAFQVPVRSFGGMIGIISINEHEGKGHRLWSHFFVVQDLGVQRLDATLSGDCTRITNPGSSLIPWIPVMCPFLSGMEKPGSVLLFTRPLTDETLACPVLLSYGDDICIITGALEVYPTTTCERKAYLGIFAFLKNLRLYIRDRLRISGEISDWHLVFGVYLLQTWHFYCLGLVYLFLHTVIWLLRILESTRTTALSKLEPPVTADDCPLHILGRKRHSSCPSSDTSLSGLSRQGLMLSGSDILLRDSWGADAHQHYFNRTARGPAHSQSFSDLLELDSDHSVNSERWSRDRNGRLIRYRPLAQPRILFNTLLR